jgi:hypothetical protein
MKERVSLAAPLLRGPAQAGAFGLRSESIVPAAWIPVCTGMTRKLLEAVLDFQFGTTEPQNLAYDFKIGTPGCHPELVDPAPRGPRCLVLQFMLRQAQHDYSRK